MKIAVLVSGGVDSSVALRLLKEQGHEVTAFYLKIWLEDELSYLGTCPWEEDLAYVQGVTQQAGVKLEVLSFQREYWDAVVSYTVASVQAGRTPNPDVMCNKFVKFGAFQDVVGNHFDKIATGHYANVSLHGDVYELHRSPDAIKDQTYFLSAMSQNQLSRALFPLGTLTKEEVRAKAHELDLPTKDRKDSQGICFLGKLKFSDFIRHHLGTKEGQLKEFESGQDLGTHEGFWYYTLGQRKAIRLSGGPWYVVAKNIQENIVYVSKNYYAPEKERKSFFVESVNWISGMPSLEHFFDVKLRHGPKTSRAKLIDSGHGSYRVQLEERDQGIAPGQFAVFYEGSKVLGGGIISTER